MTEKMNIIPRQIPLQYLYEESLDNEGTPLSNDDGTPIKNVSRLGIWTSINDAPPQRALFDTGSDQFNTQINPIVRGIKNVGSGPKEKYIYDYGNGTYGYLVQKVTIEKLTCYRSQDLDESGKLKDVAKAIDFPIMGGQHIIIGKIESYVFREDYSQSTELSIDNMKKRGIVSDDHVIGRGTYEDIYGDKIDKKFYIDLHAQKLITEGRPGDERLDLRDEEGLFSGCFGAGDYLTPKTAMGLLGGATTSGYIVSANGNNDFYAQKKLPPGCSPYVIIHLNENLRAQFTSFMPWTNTHNKKIDQEKFSGSNAPASTEYEGIYTLRFFEKKGKKAGDIDNVVALFDTGYGINGALVLGEKKFDDLKSSGYIQSDKDQASYHIDKINILSPKGEVVTLMNVSVRREDDSKDEQGNSQPAENKITVGLDFFLSQSVMYDLKHETTAYTRYAVNIHPFSTGGTADGHFDIDWNMGSLHPLYNENGKPRQVPAQNANGNVVLTNVMGGYFGVASVISGKGRLVIKNYAVSRLTAVNTYEGETHIEKYGLLELAGPGRIESSVKLVIDGTLDISQAGGFRKEWGIEPLAIVVALRDLEGHGRIMLGKHTLVLKEAKGRFDGVIVDSDGAKSLGGGLLIAHQGKLALGGKNTFTGQTEIAHGAELHITETGHLQGHVVVKGKLIVDGHVTGSITLEKDAVLSGSGTIGQLINNGGKNLRTGHS